MHLSFPNSVALRFDHKTCQFESVRFQDLAWSVTDAGTLYGAILVERFRTYGFKLLELHDYEARLSHGAQHFSIDASSFTSELRANANQLLELNRDLVHQCGDVGVVVLASPGELNQDNSLGNRPTCIMHLSRLPFEKLNQWYKDGTDLWIGAFQAVPNACWPNQIKSRSRLPYFLSDAISSAKRADSLSVLTTSRGTISDTSVANVLLVDEKGHFVSPPKEDILIGCTLQAVERLLNIHSKQIQYRNIEPKEFARASEVILTGSTGGVWFARSINGTRMGLDNGQPKLRLLIDLWKTHVGIDYIEQAAQRAVG
ncbi:MAG TPA: aminotransferase class IV [Pirellula sp.]|nr:aminotransferase class IV [Pirellula sp.]